MRKNLANLGCVVLGFALVATTHAQESPSPVSANVGVFSQYVFRGLTQTARHPAVQGGFDYAHASGVYAGTRLSNISWFSDTNPRNTASLEWDLYGGYKRSWNQGFSTDIGYLRYQYPGAYPSLPTGTVKPNTSEVYAAAGWKWSPSSTRMRSATCLASKTARAASTWI